MSLHTKPLLAQAALQGTRTPGDKFLTAARKTRLNTSHLSLEHNDPIYVNEHLCLENKILFRKARQVKAEKKWKFAWVSQGRILMRKAENSAVEHIQSEGDLARIS